MLAVGFLSFALGSWWMTYLTSDWDFWELVWPQIFRGVGLMTAMIPINNVALGTLPPERVKNASGLFNLTRNLGGGGWARWPHHHPQRPHRPPSCPPA
jgi:DHA2 family multidrug resistance protein